MCDNMRKHHLTIGLGLLLAVGMWPTRARANNFATWRAHFIATLIADKRVDANAAHRILDNVAFDPDVVATLERTSSFRPPSRVLRKARPAAPAR